MRRLAILSLHSSPLAQPGTGDGGGMNVYVRELAAALAQAGVHSVVYTRRPNDRVPDVVPVEPGFEVVHVPAGPADLAKEDLPAVIDRFADGVRAQLTGHRPADVIHANYWLSGVAGHRLKHELDLPLVSTFHTLARVKASHGDAEPEARARAEDDTIGCSDAVLASCATERDQLVSLYGAPADRIEIVPPGVDHAFFSPGSKPGARRALGLGMEPVILFVGRIQPLKGLDVAIEALARLRHPAATLVVVGGPSGTDGGAELIRSHGLADRLGVAHRIRFVDPQPHHILSTYYRAADVCVVPSRSESFGLVALEAAACGAPVVAADVGGLKTLVEDRVTGLLLADRDPALWASAVDSILADPLLADAMGRHAAAKAARGYTWAGAAARLRRLYVDLTNRSLIDCA